VSASLARPTVADNRRLGRDLLPYLENCPSLRRRSDMTLHERVFPFDVIEADGTPLRNLATGRGADQPAALAHFYRSLHARTPTCALVS